MTRTSRSVHPTAPLCATHHPSNVPLFSLSVSSKATAPLMRNVSLPFTLIPGCHSMQIRSLTSKRGSVECFSTPSIQRLPEDEIPMPPRCRPSHALALLPGFKRPMMAFHQGGTQRLWPARDTAQCPFETTLDLQTQDVLHGTTTVMSRGAARARVSRGAKNCGTFLRRVLCSQT